MEKKVSIIIPCRNEEKFIGEVLKNIIEQDYPKDLLEIFCVDGTSTDKTIEIINCFSSIHKNVFLINNKNKTVPFALNIGVKMCTGQIIVRIDAHTHYSPDYIKKIVETFEKTNADIVGGPMNPVGKTIIQKAVAYATSGWFGIGNSKFHVLNYNGFVDSVYLGAWKREIFNEVGYFDERMKRNQDDEFHYRAKSKGKKIYLNSEIKSTYFPRSSYGALFKQYFQYGLYKPLVNKKIRSEVKIRHLVPLFFVLYLLSLSLAFKYPILLLPLLFYTLIDIYNSFINNQSFNVKIATILIYPILHISYGTGFFLGLFKKGK